MGSRNQRSDPRRHGATIAGSRGGKASETTCSEHPPGRAPPPGRAGERQLGRATGEQVEETFKRRLDVVTGAAVMVRLRRQAPPGMRGASPCRTTTPRADDRDLDFIGLDARSIEASLLDEISPFISHDVIVPGGAAVRAAPPPSLDDEPTNRVEGARSPMTPPRSPRFEHVAMRTSRLVLPPAPACHLREHRERAVVRVASKPVPRVPQTQGH